MYFNCEKEQIKEAFEEIKDLVKDIKNNNMYLSNNENKENIWYSIKYLIEKEFQKVWLKE